MKLYAFLKPPPKVCNIWLSDFTLMPMSKIVKLRLVNCFEEWSEVKASWCKMYEIKYPRFIAEEGVSLKRISIFFYHRWIMNITKCYFKLNEFLLKFIHILCWALFFEEYLFFSMFNTRLTKWPNNPLLINMSNR